ncbi:MAG: hypothetical protein ACI9LV_000079 [Candidatus Nanohaloarchaea archaeon]|jgi:hypothetical protein
MRTKLFLTMVLVAAISGTAAAEPTVTLEGPSESTVGDEINLNAETDDNVQQISINRELGSGYFSVGTPKDCGGSSCSIERSYKQDEQGEITFRAKIETFEGNYFSDTLTTTFEEKKDNGGNDGDGNGDKPDEEDIIEKVYFTNSPPSKAEVGDKFEMSATVKGDSIRKASISKKVGSGFLSVDDPENCGGSSTCKVSVTYKVKDHDSGETLEFRAIGETVDETKKSSPEYVEVEKKDEPNNGGDNGDKGPDAFFTVSDSSPRVGESVKFDASESTGKLKEYRWTFPEGSTKYGKTVYRSFSSTGEKKVRLKVTDYDGDRDTYSRTLNVQDQDQCGVHVGSLRLDDYEVEEGDTTEASIKVSNTGDSQDFNIKIFRESEKVLERSTSVSRNGEERFNIDITANSDTDVRAEIRTSGEPCGSQLFERSKKLEVVDDDDDRDDGERPTARLDIDPNSADTGEEIEFDARGSTDPDGDIEDYEFDLDGDGDYELSNDDGEVERSFFEEIDRRAKVRVIDEDGYTDTDSERYRVRAGSRVSFSDIEIPDDVCAGENFEVTFTARNIGDDERLLIVEGEGFGDRNSYSTHLEEDEEDEVTVTFTTDDPGTEEFTIRALGGNSDMIENSIEVLDCGTTGGQVSGISMKVVPDRVRAGDAVKLSGYVDNARGRENVRIEMNSRRMKEVSTEPDGYYSTYIYPERTGDLQLTAKTDRYRATRDLTVLPTVTVGNIDIPETVFQGDEIEVCSEVNSQNIPAVLLVVDGEVVESKNERGDVCFETTAKKQGEVNYEIVGLARGQRSSSQREVQVHEAKPETSSFPEQVASVESGRGIVKTTIYNNNDRRKSYYVNINGLPETWTSTTEKEVVLQPGEEREVFFYLTPREEGSYDPLVTVTSDREIVYTEEVKVEVGGTSKPRNLSLFERLKNAFL